VEFVVTGGAGFIGSHLVEALLKKGGVTIVDDLSTGFQENVPEGAELVEATILDYAKLEEAVSTADAVFHLGGVVGVPVSVKHPEYCFRVNVTGTANVLQAAKEHGSQVVYASSAAIYGDNPSIPSKESDAPAPASPYAESKLKAERLVVEEGGTALRLFNVFGPRQRVSSGYAAVVPAFVQAAKKGGLLRLDGGGEQTRDFVFVEDVVNAFIKARGVRGAYNVGSGKAVSIKELARKIVSLTGSDSNIVGAPGRQGDVHDSLADVSSARKAFGFEPRYSLEEGLKKVVVENG
jgi:UDP-glucose 4-epimerase